MRPTHGRGLRGESIHNPVQREQVGLPARVFLFTIDQIGVMIDTPVKTLNMKYIYFEGRSIGPRRRDLIIARNIAPANEAPEWRVAEREFVRWLKFKGYKFYDRGAFSS